MMMNINGLLTVEINPTETDEAHGKHEQGKITNIENNLSFGEECCLCGTGLSVLQPGKRK